MSIWRNPYFSVRNSIFFQTIFSSRLVFNEYGRKPISLIPTVKKKKKRSDRKKGEEYDGWRWRWRRNRRGRKMVIKTRAHGRPRFEYRLSAGLKTIPGVLLFFHVPSRFLPRSSLPRTSNTCRGLLNSLRRHDST